MSTALRLPNLPPSPINLSVLTVHDNGAPVYLFLVQVSMHAQRGGLNVAHAACVDVEPEACIARGE
jgi:hypothetical protein